MIMDKNLKFLEMTFFKRLNVPLCFSVIKLRVRFPAKLRFEMSKRSNSNRKQMLC